MKLNRQLRILSFCGFFVAIINPLIGQDLENIKDKDPVKLNGSLGVNLISQSSSDSAFTYDPFSTVLFANATVSVYGFSMPFSFRYSNNKSSYYQPFNQFGLSPSYKWLTLHGGYRNITFSNYTLAGHTFLGGGVELNPGIFRFGAVFGKFNQRPSAYENIPDTVKAFKRTGYALKLGLGSQTTFVDLIFLNIRDDSLSASPTLPGVNPEQNVVAGINTRIKISEELWFDAELAGSVHTANARDTAFFSDEAIVQSVRNMININLSSSVATALRASLNYSHNKFNTKLEYRRISPKYKSMGAYYFNDDIENFTISPRFTLFKQKLNVSGSLGLQRDNLNNAKRATTARTISSLNLSFNPVQYFGLDATYSNYSNNQRAGRMPLVDTLKLYQVTSNLTLTPRLMFVNPERSHIIMLVFNQTGMNDKNEHTEKYTDTKAIIANLNYNLNIQRLLMGFQAGLNSVKTITYNGDNKSKGLTLGINKALLENQIQLGLNSSILQPEYADEKGKQFVNNLYASFSNRKHHSIRLNLFHMLQRFDEASAYPSFSQFKGDLSYIYSF
ncbi:MAG: hypothetical protein CSA36_05435 [Draconibacterium sp.]|nr:MAG: hypothetical protein CSA36_05435 [Draconibacterium sp.]